MPGGWPRPTERRTSGEYFFTASNRTDCLASNWVGHHVLGPDELEPLAAYTFVSGGMVYLIDYAWQGRRPVAQPVYYRFDPAFVPFQETYDFVPVEIQYWNWFTEEWIYPIDQGAGLNAGGVVFGWTRASKLTNQGSGGPGFELIQRPQFLPDLTVWTRTELPADPPLNGWPWPPPDNPYDLP